ncbi:MAG: thermonuclease family protein [Hyphomicrobiales bacterium]
MKRSIHGLFLWVFLIGLLLASRSICIAGENRVARVLDGDTIIVTNKDAKITIRLVGIDAPEISHNKHEPGQPFSQQSAKYLAGLVLNQTVTVKSYGGDRYGRILGEVFLHGESVNLEMVKSGLAEAYRGTPPKGQDMGPYWKAEEEAKKAGKGMWVLGAKYVSPREWRRMNRG